MKPSNYTLAVNNNLIYEILILFVKLYFSFTNRMISHIGNLLN